MFYRRHFFGVIVICIEITVLKDSRMRSLRMCRYWGEAFLFISYIWQSPLFTAVKLGLYQASVQCFMIYLRWLRVTFEFIIIFVCGPTCRRFAK